MMLPLHIFEPRYRKMINTCLEDSAPFGVVLIQSGPEVGGRADPHRIGTSAAVSRLERLPGGRMNIEAIGQERFRILALHEGEEYLVGTVQPYPLLERETIRAQQSAQAVRRWLDRYLALLGEAADADFDLKELPDDPMAVAYLAAMVAQIPLAEKQKLLAAETAHTLLERERVIFRRELSLLRAMLDSPQSDAAPFPSPN
jgi:Lon protease-like protein